MTHPHVTQLWSGFVLSCPSRIQLKLYSTPPHDRDRAPLRLALAPGHDGEHSIHSAYHSIQQNTGRGSILDFFIFILITIILKITAELVYVNSHPCCSHLPLELA